jgi:hypothetical protein
VAVLFTKFDPRAFLDADRHPATLASLAGLAGRNTDSETRPETDAVITGVLPLRNPREGERAAKAAKSAKDQIGPLLAASSDAGQDVRANWDAKDWRARFGERAGFLEHDGGLSRFEAELQAFESCVIEWLNANPRSSPAGRCLWCGKLETPNAIVLPFGIGEHHAWLHAECWFAWHQSRREEAAIALRRMGMVLSGSLGDHDD